MKNGNRMHRHILKWLQGERKNVMKKSGLMCIWREKMDGEWYNIRLKRCDDIHVRQRILAEWTRWQLTIRSSFRSSERKLFSPFRHMSCCSVLCVCSHVRNEFLEMVLKPFEGFGKIENWIIFVLRFCCPISYTSHCVFCIYFPSQQRKRPVHVGFRSVPMKLTTKLHWSTSVLFIRPYSVFIGKVSLCNCFSPNFFLDSIFCLV